MRAPRLASSLSGPILAGTLLYLAGVFFFALNDALGKWLVAGYSVGELLLLRTLGAAFVLVPLVWRHRPDLLGLGHPWLNLLRVACMASDTFSFYFATRTLPLADVMTIYMASPLIITALSGPLLGERVRPRQWAAVGLGFVGVVVVLRPTGAVVSGPALIALFGAVMFSLGISITRLMRGADWLPLVAWQFGFAGLVGLGTAPFAWTTPGALDLMLMFLVGLVSMGCFVCITRALALAPAVTLAPFQYTSLVWAVLLGWTIWRDVPGPAVLAGSAIIVASGLVVLRGGEGRPSPEAPPAEPAAGDGATQPIV